MSAQITITINEDVVAIKVVGRFTLQDVLDTSRVIVEGDAFNCSRRFWDLSASSFDFSSEELKIIADFGDQIEQKPVKSALWVASDLTFGLSRMYQVFRKSKYITVAVFRDESEAMHWLLSD